MQSMFRATSRKLSQKAAQSAVAPKPKQTPWHKIFIADVGNYPILAANIGAASLVVIFGCRKIFFHPDIGISEVNRFSNEIENEAPARLDDAFTFRKQTQFFADMLYLPTQFLLKFETGSDKPIDKWSTEFLRKTEIPLPLEATDAFDDGLYLGNKPQPFAENKPNGVV